MSPLWGLPGAVFAWGGAPGFINVAPLGLGEKLFESCGLGTINAFECFQIKVWPHVAQEYQYFLYAFGIEH